VSTQLQYTHGRSSTMTMDLMVGGVCVCVRLVLGGGGDCDGG